MSMASLDPASPAEVLLLRAMPAGALLCGACGHVRAANAHAAELLGVADASALVGREADALLDASLLARVRAPEANVPFSVECTGRPNLRAKVTSNAAGEAFVVALHPAADDADAVLARLRERVETLREPLAAVRAAIDTLAAYPDAGEAVAGQFHEIIQEQSALLTERLDAALDAHGRRLRAARSHALCSGHALLESVREELERASDETKCPVQVRICEPPTPIHLPADRLALACTLAQVGRLVVQATREAAFALRLQQSHEFARLDLTWTAAGVSAARLRRWAERPVRLRGTSVDLSLRAAVERHDGQMWTRPGETPLEAPPAHVAVKQEQAPAVCLLLPLAPSLARRADPTSDDLARLQEEGAGKKPRGS